MILHELQLVNFKQYGSLDLNFKEGLVGITGKNGSGKSTLFEAIILCLYGTSSSDKEFYRSSWVDKKTATTLKLLFEVNQKHYTVERAFRGKAMTHVASLYDQTGQLLASSATPVSETIVDIIGLDKDAFTRSVFSGQKELGIISNTRGEERKRMVRKMVGLDRLDHIQKLVREDRNTLKKEVQGQENVLIDADRKKEINTQIKSDKKEIATHEKEIKKLTTAFEKTNTKYQKAKTVFTELNEVYKTHNQLQQELAKYTTTIQQLEERQEVQSKEINRLSELKNEVEKSQAIVDRYAQLKQQHSEQQEKQNQFNKVENLKKINQELLQKMLAFNPECKDIDSVKKIGKQAKEDKKVILAALEKTTEQLSQDQTTLNKFQEEVGGIKSRIKEREEQLLEIEGLGKDANCPTCLQPLIQSYDQTLLKLKTEIKNYEDTTLSELTKKIKKLNEQIELSNNKLTAYRNEESKVNNKINELKSCYEKAETIAEQEKTIQEIGKINFSPESFAQLNKDLETTQQQFLEVKTKEKQAAQLPEVIESQTAIKERIKKGKELITQHQKSLKSLRFSQEKYDTQQRQMNELEQEKETLNQNLQQQQRSLQQLEMSLQGLEKELQANARIEQQIANNRTELTELEELDGIFSHFKTNILENIRPAITNSASQLFERITQGRYEGIEVDHNFEFHIYENGIAYPISRFSGGEIDLANLCLRIGISKAITELAGSDMAINFLAFDEIFGSQDDERRFEILMALDLLKEQYRQIYIISHIDTVKEHFPSILEIKRGDDGSEAVWL